MCEERLGSDGEPANTEPANTEHHPHETTFRSEVVVRLAPVELPANAGVPFLNDVPPVPIG
jgi:hypothetical protein